MPRAPETESMKGAELVMVGEDIRKKSQGSTRYTRVVFEVEVTRRFRATHAIVIDGVWEDPHDHDWGVWVTLRGTSLDHEHLLVDFHALERSLESIVKPFGLRSFNEQAPFDDIIPTAERIAEFIGLRISRAVPEGVVVHAVAVEEAPGCIARWYPSVVAGVS